MIHKLPIVWACTIIYTNLDFDFLLLAKSQLLPVRLRQTISIIVQQNGIKFWSIETDNIVGSIRWPNRLCSNQNYIYDLTCKNKKYIYLLEVVRKSLHYLRFTYKHASQSAHFKETNGWVPQVKSISSKHSKEYREEE